MRLLSCAHPAQNEILRRRSNQPKLTQQLKKATGKRGRKKATCLRSTKPRSKLTFHERPRRCYVESVEDIGKGNEIRFVQKKGEVRKGDLLGERGGCAEERCGGRAGRNGHVTVMTRISILFSRS